MKCEEIQELISQFSDGSLETEKEAFIFAHMSVCPGCRTFLKSINTLSFSAQREEFYFPPELDKKVISKTEKRKAKKHVNILTMKYPAYVSFSFGAVVILLLFLLFKSTTEYRQELHEAMENMQQQNKQIQTILNSYPEIQVRPKQVNEIFVNRKL
ncbi:MAG TPA: zf-HC2 domain-containing protein [Ignavibacteriales bacterium]|nr:zf-HC2 domain-containing protein [Ignavibacteriales bacterium]